MITKLKLWYSLGTILGIFVLLSGFYPNLLDIRLISFTGGAGGTFLIFECMSNLIQEKKQ